MPRVADSVAVSINSSLYDWLDYSWHQKTIYPLKGPTLSRANTNRWLEIAWLWLAPLSIFHLYNHFSDISCVVHQLGQVYFPRVILIRPENVKGVGPLHKEEYGK